MQLINADALYEKLEKRYKFSSGDARIAFSFALDDVSDAPTIDAVPVRHGQWIPYRDAGFEFLCSECKIYMADDKPNYCPHCGAKMDLEEVE